MKPLWNQALAKADLLASLSTPGREALAARAREIEVPRGGAAINEGDAPDWVMLVLAGEFKLTRGEGDETWIADFLAPGGLHGADAVLLGRDHDLAAVALVNSTALLIPAADLRQTIELHPRTFRVMAALAAAQNRALQERLHLGATQGVERRLHHALLRLARRFGRKGPHGAAIELRITHRELGQYIGASRENVTLALARLKKDGLLATAGRRLVILKGPRD